MAREKFSINASRREAGRADHGVIIAVLVGVIIIAALVWLFTRERPAEPVPAPDEARPGIETVAPAESPAERGDSAREIIAELEAGESADYAAAYERAQEFKADGKLADAQLLYFFAARGGHGEAAYDLATFYDPNHFAEGQSLLDEPDPFQAYRWYGEAADAGVEAADERLDELRAWAEQAAGTGNAAAEQLLLQWETNE